MLIQQNETKRESLTIKEISCTWISWGWEKFLMKHDLQTQTFCSFLKIPDLSATIKTLPNIDLFKTEPIWRHAELH